MQLTVKDRFMLLLILPREGDLSTIRVVQSLRAALSFSEEEHTALKITQDEDGYKWNPDVPQSSEIEVGPKAYVIIQDTLKRLDREKKLIEDFLPLWDKFCPETEK